MTSASSFAKVSFEIPVEEKRRMDKVVQFIVFAAICVSVRSQTVSLTDGDKDLHVIVRGNFTRSCRSIGFTHGDSIHWEKDGVKVNDFQEILSPFKETTRYSATWDFISEVVTILTITGATAEDEGSYRCVIFRKGTEKDSKSAVTVISEAPVSVTLYIDDGKSNRDENGTLLPIRDEATTTLKENIAVNVTCIVKGGNPAPTVTMRIAQGNIHDDIPFTTTNVVKQFGVVNGFRYNRTVSQTVNDHVFAPQYSMNGKDLVCRAYVNNIGEFETQTKLTVTETAENKTTNSSGEAPVLEECGNRLVAYVGDESKNTFTCNVKSKGAIDFKWDLPSNFTISVPADNFEKRYRTTTKKADVDVTELKLVYLIVSKDDSGVIYLTVNNTHGMAKANFSMLTKGKWIRLSYDVYTNYTNTTSDYGATSGSKTLVGSLLLSFVTFLMAGFITLQRN